MVLLLVACKQVNSKNGAQRAEHAADTVKTETAQANFEETPHHYSNDSITALISLFRERNIDKISNKIIFPLRRAYPVPSIKNQEEFKRRFNEVFDKTLIERIAHSKPEQWSDVGWRGIMLDDGVLWISEDDGMITAVNYQSDFEKKRRTELILTEKRNLHASLKNFESPAYRIKTDSYLIRIDELTANKYRYASWKTGENESSEPDIVLKNGKLEFQGSGGNHMITFVNGNYLYKVYRNIIGEENRPEITLIIEKDGEIILTQDGTLISE